ncbi:MAG TPA: hypothetical protein VJ349_11465 [Stellaceae bacterium]|nr:hypothetical protein [Stellaceae bacterium]
MSSARPKSRRGLAAGAFWQWHCALWLLLFRGATAAIPAAAQTSEGGAPSSPGAGPEAGPAVTGGEAVTTPTLPGAVPETLPPPSIGGYGFPNPAAPPYSVNNQLPTLTSPATLQLQPYGGVVPLQAYDPNAPAVLIRPSVSLGEIFTDNVNYVHSPRTFAAITQLGAGVSASVDTPRLQAVATGQGTGSIYLPGSNSTLNQIYGGLYANGHGTVYPDLLYVDAQSSITQSTTLPGFGLQNLSTLPRNQQTQQFITNISPYLIKSFGGVADTELRYTFSSSNYGGNTAVAVSPVPGLNNLASTTINEGTFIAVTGQDFQKTVVRFTADAAELNGSFANQSTQVNAYNDLQYNFTPMIAALGRAGYQNLRYPGSPAATFAGATWLAGGRIGTVGPDQPAYVALQYGRQQGSFGLTGSSQVNITPTLVFSANAVQGVSSQGQFFSSNLANSTLSPSGGIVNQSTGLPIALSSPGLGISNNVYRQHLFTAGLTDSLPPNSYSLYGSYLEAQSLSATVGVPTKSINLNFTYSRDIRPDASGYASIGFTNSVNSPTVVPGTTTVNFSQRTNFNTVYATAGLNYVLGPTLTGSIIYTFSYQTNGTVLAGGRNGDVFANQLQFLLSKTF